MKKILSLVLALLMSASAASMIGAAEDAAIAEDAAVETTAAATTETTQYDEAIRFLHEYGIYKGKSATDLAAADPIERYQMALFVARISTGWVDDAKWAVADQWYDRDHDTSGFDDLEGTPATNYLGALSYASQKGIIEGYGNKKFGPTDGITYQNALTMIVRTLGYTNLSWPWGYIEKAVTLGLTVGIPASVKYTDELNRGEVAQLIYNALFIPTKEGDTLAARNFNGELGWETIIITVAGRGRYVAEERMGDQGYPTDAGNDIGFRVVKEDGTLDGTTYYVKNDDEVSFHFEGHKEKFLGYAYKALFTKDENSNYVTLISAKSLKEGETIWNYGLPTKDEDGKYPITKALAGVTLVSKFSKNTYLNTLNGEYGIKEYILKNALQKSTITVDAGRKYAIDWTTGNILQVVETKNEKTELPYIEYKENGVDYKFQYNVAWYYNELLNQYFRFKTVDKNGEIEFVGIDVLDPADVQNIIDTQRLTKEATSHSGLTDTGIKNTAYASLVQFNLPGYTTPNYGLYEEYRFGKYTEGKVKLNDHEVDGSMIIQSLDAVAEPMYKEVTGKNDFQSGTVKFIKEGACSHNHAIGFFSDDERALTPSVGDYIIYSADESTGEVRVIKIIYDASNEKADKDNFVATGIVRAYNVPNKTVTIGETKYSYDYNELNGNPFAYTEGTDKTWGPLYRAAFSRYFKSLFNQYVKYVVVDGKLVWVEKINASNQLIVVDSYAGLSSDGYIVVNGYKTDDLKYAQFRIGSYNSWVKGDYYYYLTDEKVEDSFTRGSLYRITSYDDKNDVYYVFTVGKEFVSVPETYTTVKVGDKEYIDHIHYIGKDGKEVIIPKKVDKAGYTYLSYDFEDGLSGEWQTFEFADGYRSINGEAYTKTNAKDTYILVCNPIDDKTKPNTDWTGKTKNYKTGGDYAPIIVYTGRVTSANWAVEGFRIKGTGDNSFVLVGVDFNKVVGFDADQYDINYVLFLHYDYTKAAYDSADADGWYLLGASNFEATVFNWYNGEIETKTAVNKDLKMGYSYPSINGVIVNDAPYTAWELNAEIPGAYQWQYEINSKNTPHYLFGCTDTADPKYDANGRFTEIKLKGVDFTGIESTDSDTYKKAFNKYFDKENFSLNYVSKAKGLTIKVKDLVSSIKVFLPEFSDGYETVKEVTRLDAAAMNAWVRDNKIDVTSIYFWWIMDKSGNVVVYLRGEPIKEKVPDVIEEIAAGYVEVTSSWNLKNRGDRDAALIKATVSGIKKDAKLVEDNTSPTGTGYTIKGGDEIKQISFEWEGAVTGENHRAVDLDDFHFGRTDDCDKINWNAVISYNTDDPYRDYDDVKIKDECIVTGLYDNHSHDAEDPKVCDLIKSISFNIDAGKIKMPDWSKLELTDPDKTEVLKRAMQCHDGVDPTLTCGCWFDKAETIAYTNFLMDPIEIQGAIDWLNWKYACAPAQTTINVKFWDSNATGYDLTVVVYAYAVAAAKTNVYGHTEFVFDHVEYAADVVKATITPSNFAPNAGNRPVDAEYMDLEVSTIAYDINPEFGLIVEYGAPIKNAAGKAAYIPVSSKLGYKYAGHKVKIAKDTVIADAGLTLPDGTVLPKGALAADTEFEAVAFEAMVGGALPTGTTTTVAKNVVLNDTFLAYYDVASIPDASRK